MSLKKYNTTKANWKIDTSNFNYVKIRELEENKTYPLRGVFVSPDNGYGEGAVIITDSFCVNVPARYVDVFRKIMEDDEAVDQINAGTETWHFEKFISEKYKREGYRIIFD